VVGCPLGYLHCIAQIIPFQQSSEVFLETLGSSNYFGVVKLLVLPLMLVIIIIIIIRSTVASTMDLISDASTPVYVPSLSDNITL